MLILLKNRNKGKQTIQKTGSVAEIVWSEDYGFCKNSSHFPRNFSEGHRWRKITGIKFTFIASIVTRKGKIKNISVSCGYAASKRNSVYNNFLTDNTPAQDHKVSQRKNLRVKTKALTLFHFLVHCLSDWFYL